MNAVSKPRPRFESNKKAPDTRKLRGGYYTPGVLADYLCRWAIRRPCDRVVEPSCGNGSFVFAAGKRLDDTGHVTAIEVVQAELEKAKARVNGISVPVIWRGDSFFRVMPDLLRGEQFDVVVGNPPFIRFQHFAAEERAQAFSLANSFGYRPNGLANAWASFVELSAELLREGGRLAMVVPAELLQVQYAAELRVRLPRLFRDVYIVAFDELVFPEIQQEVVLLLGEGRTRHAETPGRLHTVQTRNGNELPANVGGSEAVSHVTDDHADTGMKWTSLFLPKDELEAMQASRDHPGMDMLGKLADVDVGIVTGRNRFFVVGQEEAGRLQLGKHGMDVVGRTSALTSLRFTVDDLRSYAERHPSKLLNLGGWEETLFPAPLKRYIEDAEAHGVHQGYKCRIRRRWFDVPSVYAPDAFLHRQIHHAPLLATNLAGATSTDTIHRVRMFPGIDVRRASAAMVNSLTFAWAEVVGRSYGGGVLELEPREAERLLLPYKHAENVDVEYMDAQLRAGNIEAAADHGDQAMLRDSCGMADQDIRRARSAWLRLRGRRHRRRHTR